MWKTVLTPLLFACISQCLCQVTWISPLDGDTETIAENETITTLIDTLNATSSNDIAYVMVSQTPSDGRFGIRDTNQLYLKAGLDYEDVKFYEVVIRAVDSTAGEEADITLNITVSDINDKTPVITSDTTKDLSERTTVDSVVFTVTSTDEDTVGTVTYSITGGNDNGVFSINATTGEITLKTALNITVTPEYDIEIEATDGVNTAPQTITFYVTDIIWHTPTDDQTDLKAENTTADSTIITLEAENALGYSFEVVPASEKSKFRIRGTNLVLEQSLDYETTKSYIFTLTAIGTSPSAVVTYTLNITDVNDVALTFEEETVTIDLTKDTDIGTVVYTAEVTDPDTVGTPTFSIEGGNANEDFIIDTATGDITLDKGLAPDVTPAYSLIIQASDGVFTATMTLSITVNEVVWTDPPKGTSEDLREDTPINTVIKNLTAETATTYIIRSQTPTDDQFGIINTNELVLLSQLDYDAAATSHIISLRATDVSGKSADITYIVNVTDVNDLDPVFVSGTFEVIPDNTPVGSTIHTASATDGDTVGTLSYSITAGNDDGVFDIDSSSGNITLASALIPNTTVDLTYNLIIEVTDSLHPVTQALTISIKTAPVLVLPVNGTNITENADTSGPLVVLVLDSTDLDNDLAPEYSIDTQSHPGTFSISDDNTLITTASFDRETISEYNVTLRVTDSSIFDLSSAATLIVTIEDENDVSPTFTSNATLDLADDTPASNTLIVYTATTEDPDILGAVTYSISAGDTNTDFNMNSNGSMSLNNALDASVTPTYTLTLDADDTANVAQFNLTVKVVTEPQFDIPASGVELAEGNYTSHPVWTFSVTDVDNDTDPTVAILDQSVNGTFELSGDNKQLVTSATFDFDANLTSYTVTLQVTDSSSLKRSSTAILTINITDVNDESPAFNPASTLLELREDTAIGLVDYQAAAIDPDSTSLTYTISDGNTNDVFSMDADSGNLSLAKTLTSFDDLRYDLIVQANDTINVGTQLVNVTVFTAPIFEFPDSVEIAENIGIGDLVLELNSTDRDGDQNPIYEIVSQSDPGSFELNADNTTIITAALFDYETKTNYNVTLKVTDTSQFSMSTTDTVVISITDTNDNPPVFQSNDTVEISEFTAEGTGVYDTVTSDVDTGSVVTYSFIDGNTNEAFSINETSGEITLASALEPNVTLTYILTLRANDSVQTTDFNLTVNVKTAPTFVFPSTNITISEDADTASTYTVWTFNSTDLDQDTDAVYEIVSQSVDGTFDISADNADLTTNASFDFETTQMYTVTLRATDNSMFQLSSTATLTVYITDANDNRPEFTSVSIIDLPEFQENNTVVYQTETRDNDTVGTVSYSIIDGNSDEVFSIDSDSGNVTIIKALDPDTTLTYTLTIQANDSVNTANLTLTANVISVPTITPLQINITENSVTGEYEVWNLTSSDIDGDAGPVYSLVNQSDADVFRINDAATAVVTNVSFDYESKTQYTFEIQVTDNSSLQLSSSAIFTVSIIDENDVTPNFTSSAAVDVLEDTAINTTVYTAVTEDPDTLGSVAYTIIAGNDDGIFAIDEVSGNITLEKTLNASDTVTHVLRLQANDTTNVATFNLTFNVRTAPFMNIPDLVSVIENVADGTEVLTLVSTDLDGDNNPVYELESQSVPGTFKITDDNTKLVTNASIDYESVQNFTVTVRVTEISDLNLTSTTQFTVFVVDANDKSPVFTSNNSTEVAENTDIGDPFYTAAATDEDTMANLSFSIIHGDSSNVFSINPDNGSLSLQSVLNVSTVDDLTYLIGILVNDSYNTATLNLTVNVKTAPVIHVIDIYLPEDTDTAGVYSVWQINSTDLDGDENATFAIVSQSDPGTFEINSDNEIVTSAPLDFETTKNYTVTLNATDSSIFKLSTTATLVVQITDVNDNSPVFTSNASLVVLETANIGDVLANITTDDVDTVGNTTYSIIDGNRNGDFAIGSSSGELTLVNKLNPQNETDLVYDLVIEANDTVNTATQNLTVNVKTAPLLTFNDVSIDENTDTSGPYVVTNVTWSDLDNDLNPTIEIAVESVPGTFQLVNDTVLVTSAEFDYENTTMYTVTLRITDVHGLSYNDTLTLLVLDVNDMPPVFVSAASHDISEETANGTVVYTANATDPDTSPTMEYSITDGNNEGFFSINAADGTLTLVKEFNSTTSLEYNLTLQANDSVNIGELNLTINVITVPTITPLQINITENSVAGEYEVWTLVSNDIDGDPNPVYSLVNQSDADVFRINDAATAVVTNTSFDYESKTQYTFEIQVTDSSSLQLLSSAIFTVSIIDENDVTPNFTSSAAVDVLEDTPINNTVYTAITEDPDTIGSITYTILAGNDDGIFAIDEVSGNITLEKTLNASDTVTHMLRLQANDTTNVATFNLTLNVRTAPFMNIPDLVSVLENVADGTEVLTFDSTDLDGDNNPVYELESQSVPGTFKITDDNTKLVTNASIDYESVQNFTVTVRVTEISDLDLTSTTEFTVYVVDANDRSPVFTSDNSTEVAENTDIGVPFYTAAATDEDTMANLSFSIIHGDSSNVFSINPDNGSLSLQSVLNVSTVDDLTYLIGILVNDSYNTATLNLTVNVKTAPVIHVIDIYLPEDTDTAGVYSVWQINSTDLDGDENATFAIVSQSDPGTFEINSDNEIVTSAPLDFETTKNYTVTLNATDSSIFKLSTTATLVVQVTDINDNSPVFTSNASLVVLETANTGDVLANITTDDVDTVGNTTYSIIDGNRNGDFAIGTSSGKLTLVNKLNPQNETDLVNDLVIEANDTVNTATQNLTVNVKTAPYLIIHDVTIDENTDTSGPYVVTNVTWSDLDNDLNPTIEIAVESVPGTFQLVNDTVLVTSAEFDYENTTMYTVTLRITDVHGLSYNDTLTLLVLDVNDMPPVFVSAASHDISEETANGSAVYTANATDPDTHPTIEYSITDGNSESFFSINAADGTLTLVKEFNSTTSLEYNLTLQANDTLNIGELNLTINVITVPVIDAYQINITENNVPGIVWNFTSSDRDDNENPVYVLVNQSDVGIFEINDDRTAVITNTSFDFESQTVYTFEIQVTDTSSLQLSSAATFTVSIVDDNDITPEFNSSAVVKLEEDTALNTTVYVAVTIDEDTIGTTTYSIIAGNDDNLFEIDAVSGNVTLVKEFNASATLVHVLTLQANDTVNVATFSVTFTLGTVPVLVIPDNVTVVEGVDIGSDVLTLVSIDLDNDTNPVYEIVNQSVPGTFKLNENNTILVTNATIDYESLKNVTVTLRVSDNSNFNKSSTSEFTISVVDANDESPVFTSENSADVPETAENGTVIYTAVTTDVDTIGGASYSIIGGNPGVFDIDANNGNLTLQSKLSPTTVDDITYNLLIQVNDSVNTANLSLTVNVKAVPVIHVVDIELPENVNTTDTYTVWQINATDLNSEENITFAIVSQSDPGTFEINSDDAIVTTATFDYETTKNYTIVINATDSSSFMLSATATVTVLITDVNDVTPTFTSSTSPLVVLQTTRPGTVLYNTTSDDIDTVGTVVYNITDGNRNDDFSIDPNTGQLTLQNNLDPQVVSDIVYNLVIEANDSVNTAYLNLTVDVKTVPYLNVIDMNVTENTDTSQLYHVWTIVWTDLDGDVNQTFEIIGESIPDTFYIENEVLVTNTTLDYETVKNYTATISITDVNGLSSNDTLTLFVLDQNDVTPTFTSNATLDLWEETNTDEVEYTLVTTDPDTIGITKYSLEDGNTDTKFDLDVNTGELTLINALDFARTQSYNLQFSANDSENVAFFNLTVNVKTRPVINFTGVNVEISEGEDIFFVLLNLTSTDPDNDPNPQYDIIGESNPGTFVIDGDKLKTNVTFDFEILNQYSVTIRVTDSSLGLTSNDTLMVSITDINDNAPIIHSPLQPLEFREDTLTGTVLFTVNATDADTVSNVSFSITDGDTNDVFSIDGVTGNVTLSKEFNASEQIKYILGIKASDGFLESTINVEIDIKTAPVLVFPDTNITIPEDTDTSGNYSVWTLQSSDLDNDTNPRYELVSESVAGTFFLSDDNTELLTTTEFNYTDVTMYEVTLRVIDSSQFEMTSTGTLQVYITDVNNLKPTFTSPSTLEIPENQATGSVVYTAVAVDTDTVGELSYSIRLGNINDVFSLDAQSGNLTLDNALTPSALVQYVLELQVNDTVNTAILLLTVDVKTIPAIVVPDDDLTIVETADTTGPYVVLELNSTDLDNDPNPVYTIISQTVNDTFEITNDTLLTTTATFDYETRTSYEIVVQVTDTSDFALSSTAILTVLISNADDTAPVFTSETEKYISEKETPGTVVYTAKTYDNDTMGNITYSIIGGDNDDDFSMDPASGVITLVNELRPRDILTYNLQLLANDSLNLGYLNLTVNVVTVPQILFPAERVTIVENTDTSSGYIVWICASQDFDEDKDPVYSVVSQSVNDTFELNTDKTRLITTANFDYEETQSYEIVIRVTDTSPLQLSSTATLTVYIDDVNDVKPNFTSPASVKILENTDQGTVVYTVVTEDPDTVGDVTYKFTDGNTNGDFSIGAASGNITVVNVLNATATANYTLVIQANDTVNVDSLTLLVELKPDIDECASNPCKNSATCVDGIDEFTCNCAPGYDGVTCDNDIDECAEDPCLNGATCQHGIDEYNCTCADGFSGDNCEIDDDECQSSPCQNGTCLDLVNGYNCTCLPGYEGVNCEIDIDECKSGPCQHNGTCEDGVNGYTCLCAGGYDGDNCENDIDECESVVCTNNGTCFNLVNDFNCTCQPGYTGQLCEQDVKECASNPCQNSVTCVDNVNGYSCICLPGYTGDNCETDIDDCALSPCKNGATCEDGVNSFTCNCSAGYRGPRCQDQCAANTFGKGCNQNCACNDAGIISCNNVNGSCNCNAFYKGDRCETEIDECENTSLCNKTNEGCNNIIGGGYNCSCVMGFERNVTSGECDIITTPVTTTPVPATKRKVSVKLVLDLALPVTVDLQVSATFQRYAVEVEFQLRVRYSRRFGLSVSFSIIIRTLRRGSLEVEYDVIVDETDVPKVALANTDIASDTTGIPIFNETALPTAMDVNNSPVPVGEQVTDAVACQAFEAIAGPCTGDYVCNVKDGNPGCQLKETEDNLPLILGLGIGIPAFFVALAVIVLCVAYYNNKNKFLRRKYRDDYDDRSNEMYDRKLPVRVNTGPPTWPFIASPEHAEYNYYPEYSREGGQRYLPSEDFHGQYDNAGAQDRDSNNYTWDYLDAHLRPGEPYHIRRPKYDYK